MAIASSVLPTVKTTNAVTVDQSRSPGNSMGVGASAKPTTNTTTAKTGTTSTYSGASSEGYIPARNTTTAGGNRNVNQITGGAADNNPKNPDPPVDDYTPTYTSSTPAATTSSAPSVNTSADPYAAENAAAAATTQRITQGVDMSDKIAAADTETQGTINNFGTSANDILNQLQNTTNENINTYQGNAQEIINQLSNITGQQLADYAANTGQTIDQAMTQINNILAQMQQNMQPVEAGRVGNVDITEQQNILQEMTNNQREQANNQIDYAVNQGVTELQRALEDAAPQFQTQRNQIAAAEKTARDNSALYSEMRGDRGGIGKAQYDAIANTAATNQLTVNKEQTKLSTDTARQIADLRAKGEFDKADKMLEISQEYLSKLMQLKQWADEANIGIDEFNLGVEQWEQEYNAKLQQALGELGINAAQYEAGQRLNQQEYLTNQGLNQANTQASQQLGLESDINKQRQNLNDALASYGLSNAQYMSNADISRIANTLNAYMNNAQNMASTELAAANVTGAFGDNTLTMANREAQADRLASAAQQMIASGITPTDAQLKGLGWSRDQYNAYKSAVDAAAAAAAAARRGGSVSKANQLYSQVQTLIKGGVQNDIISSYINQHALSQSYTQSDVDAANKLWSDAQSGGYNGKADYSGT